MVGMVMVGMAFGQHDIAMVTVTFACLAWL